jgi:hypothetical protein
MKFSIRDILWLTILAAVAVAWWLDHRANLRRQDELQRQVMESRYFAEIERAQRALAESQAALERTTREIQAQDLTLELQKAKQYFQSQQP